jgi:TATA-binding protein-associated factor Taf7
MGEPRVPSIRPDRRAPQLVAAASAPSPAGVDEHEDDDEDGESDERSTDPERLTRETHLLTSFAKEYEAKCSAVSVVA